MNVRIALTAWVEFLTQLRHGWLKTFAAQLECTLRGGQVRALRIG